MNEQATSLQASFWFMIVLQTLGSVDMPGRGPRKMPAPRAYAAIIVTWGVLQLAADMGGERAGRAAKAVAWVIVLAGMVVGPFGSTVTNLLNSVANNVAPSSTPSSTSGGFGTGTTQGTQPNANTTIGSAPSQVGQAGETAATAAGQTATSATGTFAQRVLDAIKGLLP
jgi:hypothetical protein